MKKYVKILFALLIIGSSCISCSPEKVTEGDVEMDVMETQSIDGRGRVLDKPTSNED